MTSVPTIGPDTEGQFRFAVIVADAVKVHAPGPLRGTTATAKPGESDPASAPLSALALSTRAGDLALKAITTRDGGAVVTVVWVRCVGCGLVVGGDVGVVDRGVVVATGAPVVGTREAAGGGVP
jgi:hypothetical protein